MRHLREGFSSGNEHLVGLLRQAADGPAQRVAAGCWSAAQVGWHVASVNTRFAALMSGDSPGAKSLADDFVETPWGEIVSRIPGQLDAPSAVRPPAGVTRHDSIAALEASALKMARALDTLTPERGMKLGVTNPLVGTINLYQLGDWAVSHVVRHYRQAERALGE
ncbi:MAG: DinB family protein [Acidobacteria bacterium]|nr:DinB family protein [Acidobacteriota bacterium]